MIQSFLTDSLGKQCRSKSDYSFNQNATEGAVWLGSTLFAIPFASSKSITL